MATCPEGRPPGDPSRPGDGARRQTIEFLVVLALGILILRAYAAEAYVVPTGSMAPTLLGFHRELTCPGCSIGFTVGIDEDGRSGRVVCPNCGRDRFGPGDGVECGGDRLLVQKFFYDLRRPRRWEVAVFRSPAETDQAYVKRVVGLPGESVQVIDGDLMIDGRIARKGEAERRAMRMLVFDNDHPPRDADRFPRWTFRGDRYRSNAATGWEAAGAGFVHRPSATSADREDWVEYRHRDPARDRYGPVRDFCPYDGADVGGDAAVRDLMLEAEVACRDDARSASIRFDRGDESWVIQLPAAEAGPPEVRRNGRVLELRDATGALATSAAGRPTWSRVEASIVDRRLSVSIDGRPAFAPIDFEAAPGPPIRPDAPPLAIGVLGGGLQVRGLRIYRDIYYTGERTARSGRTWGIDEPYRLGADEFFVLGDNSPISNDSRFWAAGPVVPGSGLVGKPFLVHLPGQLTPLRVLGRELGWIPDPREIRYIR